MKRTLLALAVLIFVSSCAHTPEWRLSWEENFDSPQIDTSVWSTISRGTAAWRDTQSSDARCYDWRDGKLVLRGIVNDDRTVDTAAYLTGGLMTEISIVGGFLILASGLSILKIKEISTMNLLPGLFVPPVWFALMELTGNLGGLL